MGLGGCNGGSFGGIPGRGGVDGGALGGLTGGLVGGDVGGSEGGPRGGCVAGGLAGELSGSWNAFETSAPCMVILLTMFDVVVISRSQFVFNWPLDMTMAHMRPCSSYSWMVDFEISV